MKLSLIPGFVLIVACGVVTPLVVAFGYSFFPTSWTDTSLTSTITLFVLNLTVVSCFTLICYKLTTTFGLHQVLVFSITALIVIRSKQLVVSTSNLTGIIEAGTLLVACLLVFCAILLIQRTKKD